MQFLVQPRLTLPHRVVVVAQQSRSHSFFLPTYLLMPVPVKDPYAEDSKQQAMQADRTVL